MSKRMRRGGLLVLWLLLAAYPLVEGFAYYTEPLSERPFTSLHATFKPSGLVGQGLGILGSLMIMVGVATYSLRKRWDTLRELGTLQGWLVFHIFLCTLGPFFILLHTTFKFGNIASIAFWSMVVVVCSGIFGRYVYAHIPKTVNGRFWSQADIKDRQASIVASAAEKAGLSQEEVTALLDAFRSPPARGLGAALVRALRLDVAARRTHKQLAARLAEHRVAPEQRDEVRTLLLEGVRLHRRGQVAVAFKRLFGYWHVLHLPLALVMLVAFLLHVGVAIAFGYTWIF